jgi:hypothetical protein
MTRNEVGELYRKLQSRMIHWLCGQGQERDQAEDTVNDAFCYLLEMHDKRSGLPIRPRYQRHAPAEVESLLWDRIRGEVKDKRREEKRRLEAQFETIRGLDPSIFEGIGSSNHVEEN